MTSGSFVRSFAAALVSLALCAVVGAQTPLLQELRTISSGAKPVEHGLDIAQVGDYHLTLTDLQVPAALTSAKLAVTSDTDVLGTAATTPTSLTSSLDFTAAAAGSFTIRVVARPATDTSGAVLVTVTRASDSAVIDEFVSSFSPPPPELAANRGTLNTTFTPGSSTYEVVLSDLAVPEAIPNLILSLTRVGGSIVDTLSMPGSFVFTGEAGAQYLLVADGIASTSVNAGVFGVRVRDIATNATVFSQIVTIGSVTELGKVTLAAGPHTLSLSGFMFPVALAQGAVGVAFEGQAAAPPATLAGPGSVGFTAKAGEHVIYGFATPAPSSSGTYSIDLAPQGGASVFSTVKAVNAPASTTTGLAGYTFVVDVATAGDYRVRLADFAFPSAFTGMGLGLAASQSGTLLGNINAAGTLDLTNVAAGRLFLVVLAQPDTAGGLFGVDVAPAAGGPAIFEATQGVGVLSTSRKLTVSAAGNYRVRVTDLSFPAAFAQLSAIVTRGADASVAIFGSDQFDFAATPGDYAINLIAEADATEQAGTYGLNVSQLPPAPTVTLTATPAQVTVGNTVRLDWSSTDATTCTASGGWSGSKSTSGNETTAAITATTTFTLECSGIGGSGTQSVTVTATPPARRGGGGAFDWPVLLVLSCAALISARRRYVSTV